MNSVHFAHLGLACATPTGKERWISKVRRPSRGLLALSRRLQQRFQSRPSRSCAGRHGQAIAPFDTRRPAPRHAFSHRTAVRGCQRGYHEPACGLSFSMLRPHSRSPVPAAIDRAVGADERRVRSVVLARNLLARSFDGPVMPVHPGDATVPGLLAYRSVADLPVIPARRHRLAAGGRARLDRRPRRRVPAVVVISAGFDRAGPAAGAALRQGSIDGRSRMAADRRSGFPRPNGAGTWHRCYVRARAGRASDLAFVSQSGSSIASDARITATSRRSISLHVPSATWRMSTLRSSRPPSSQLTDAPCCCTSTTSRVRASSCRRRAGGAAEAGDRLLGAQRPRRRSGIGVPRQPHPPTSMTPPTGSRHAAVAQSRRLVAPPARSAPAFMPTATASRFLEQPRHQRVAGDLVTEGATGRLTDATIAVLRRGLAATWGRRIRQSVHRRDRCALSDALGPLLADPGIDAIVAIIRRPPSATP